VVFGGDCGDCVGGCDGVPVVRGGELEGADGGCFEFAGDVLFEGCDFVLGEGVCLGEQWDDVG
jgi:hypothetical protein